MLGDFNVTIIHQALTWTIGSLTCICDLFVCVSTQWGRWFIVPSKGLYQQQQRSRHMKGSTECYLLGQNTIREFPGWSPLSSYKTTLKQELNSKNKYEKWNGELPLICFWLNYVVSMSSNNIVQPKTDWCRSSPSQFSPFKYSNC